MKVLRRPYHVTTHKLQYNPKSCNNCSPIVQPIWQNSTIQLFEGGNWDGTKDQVWINADGSMRTKPVVLTPYEGCDIIEPHPSVASAKTTGETVRYLWRSGRCQECIINILSDQRYAAGAYYRWNPEWCQQIIDNVDSTDTDDYYSAQITTSVPIDSLADTSIGTETVEEKKPFKVEIKQQSLESFMRWLCEHPEAMQKDIHAARLFVWSSERKNKSITDAYLKHMESEGLVRKYKKNIPGKKGHPVAYEVLKPVQQESFMSRLSNEECMKLLDV